MAIAEIAGAITVGAGAVEALSRTVGAVKEAASRFGGDSEAEIALKLRVADLITEYHRVQEAYADLHARYRETAEENARLKKFDAEREHYVLTEIGPHSFAYLDKRYGSTDQKSPCFCAACFERQERSILQFAKRQVVRDLLRCAACKAEVWALNGIEPPKVRHGVVSPGW